MSFFAELKRRNVIRVAVAYVVVAWVVAQVGEFAFENFGAPDWVLKSVIVLLLLGLPLAIIFAWAFELTPEGIKREKEVDRNRSITAQTGRKLDRTIIVVLAIALAWFAWDKFGNRADDVAATAASGEIAPAAPSLADKSVAVLPFVAMSSGPDDGFFADGLTEEILNSLAQLPELLVTARTSAFAFKDQDVPLREIARKLRVRHIVEGSVRRSGDRLRITAQLIRADDGVHLWSDTYDSMSADTISVQENIAEEIATALDVVLDASKRAAMREAGINDVAAFTAYQKGLALYERAHGEMDLIDGLRQANGYFEQVIEREPDYWRVYTDHSDLYVHMLNDSAAGVFGEQLTDEMLADAYATAIADYEAASRLVVDPRHRALTELDLAFISGNWRGLAGRLERALAEPGCYDGNWAATVADVLGYGAEYYELAAAVLACDPLRTISWFNAARAKLWAGDPAAALEIAREGFETAPGTWLTMTSLHILIANGLHDEADRLVLEQLQDDDMVQVSQVMISAHRGDPDRLAARLDEIGDLEQDRFFGLAANAWIGNRDVANRMAAEVDASFFGHAVLWQVVHWCQCGAPFDLEATPNFAAKIAEANLAWPPRTPLSFPLKDW